MSLEAGDKAPDFTLADRWRRHGHACRSSRASKVVLYFYPKDDTSGCTAEACGFRDIFPNFRKIDAAVIGISRDSVASHDKFKKKYELPFTLAADTKARCARNMASGSRRACMGANTWGSSARPS